MAVYFLNVKTFGRSTGGSGPAAAAYRAGERIKDERTGKTHDHSPRQDVLHKEIILPSKYASDDMSWARDRSQLWNAAESAEKRSNARVAREYMIALPFELTPESRLSLARGYSQELTDRYGFALDLTIHSPRDFPGSDPRNFHAHLLATTREVNLEGFGAKTSLEVNDYTRLAMGLKPALHELFHARERWAHMTNQALRDAQVSAQVDHRSLSAQGIDRQPRERIPDRAFHIERQGFYSPVAQRIRAEHETRARSQEERVDEPTAERRPTSLEEIRRQAREDWLRARGAADSQAREADPAERSRGLDDDLAL